MICLLTGQFALSPKIGLKSSHYDGLTHTVCINSTFLTMLEAPYDTLWHQIIVMPQQTENVVAFISQPIYPLS
jgi:hypothetical protein